MSMPAFFHCNYTHTCTQHCQTESICGILSKPPPYSCIWHTCQQGYYPHGHLTPSHFGWPVYVCLCPLNVLLNLHIHWAHKQKWDYLEQWFFLDKFCCSSNLKIGKILEFFVFLVSIWPILLFFGIFFQMFYITKLKKVTLVWRFVLLLHLLEKWSDHCKGSEKNSCQSFSTILLWPAMNWWNIIQPHGHCNQIVKYVHISSVHPVIYFHLKNQIMFGHSKNCTLWIFINPQDQAAKNAVQTDSDPQLLCIRNKRGLLLKSHCCWGWTSRVICVLTNFYSPSYLRMNLLKDFLLERLQPCGPDQNLSCALDSIH